MKCINNKLCYIIFNLIFGIQLSYCELIPLYIYKDHRCYNNDELVTRDLNVFKIDYMCEAAGIKPSDAQNYLAENLRDELGESYEIAYIDYHDDDIMRGLNVYLVSKNNPKKTYITLNGHKYELSSGINAKFKEFFNTLKIDSRKTAELVVGSKKYPVSTGVKKDDFDHLLYIKRLKFTKGMEVLNYDRSKILELNLSNYEVHIDLAVVPNLILNPERDKVPFGIFQFLNDFCGAPTFESTVNEVFMEDWKCDKDVNKGEDLYGLLRDRLKDKLKNGFCDELKEYINKLSDENIDECCRNIFKFYQRDSAIEGGPDFFENYYKKPQIDFTQNIDDIGLKNIALVYDLKTLKKIINIDKVNEECNYNVNIEGDNIKAIDGVSGGGDGSGKPITGDIPTPTPLRTGDNIPFGTSTNSVNKLKKKNCCCSCCQCSR